MSAPAAAAAAEAPPTIGIGVLGAAHIAKKACRALGLCAGARVVAVGARDAARARALLDEFASPDQAAAAAAYGSYDEVLADPRVDAVYIPLPSALHVEWVAKAAAAGKSVLVEKPISSGAPGEVDAMLAACAAAGVQFMDGTMWAHSARAAKIESELLAPGADGPLGEVRHVTAQFTFLAVDGFWDSNVRALPECDPLGCVGDLGWYCVRVAMWAMGWDDPIAVVAHAGAELSPTPRHVGATLLFSRGRRAEIETGFDVPLSQWARIQGTKGSVEIPWFVIPREERRSTYTVTREHAFAPLDLEDVTKVEEVEVRSAQPQEVAMWDAFAALAARVRAGGVPDGAWPRRAAAVQRVVDAVAASARGGCREVRLDG